MAVAGQKKSLQSRLGLKPGQTVLFLNPPGDYSSDLGALPAGIELKNELSGGFHFIQLFTKHRAELEERLPFLKSSLVEKGMLWVSWPRKGSGIESEVTEDIIREVALKNGLVDVKVATINDTWSGLKLVLRKPAG